MDTPRVLIIDDEPIVCMFLRRVLGGKPWFVDSAPSAEAGLDKIDADTYDAILVDKSLPGMNGVEMIRHLRSVDQSVACILITANATLASAEEVMRLGGDGYLEKPLQDAAEIVAKVDNAIKLSTARRRLATRAAAVQEAREARAARAARESPAAGDEPFAQAAAPQVQVGDAAVVTQDTEAFGAVQRCLGRLVTRVARLTSFDELAAYLTSVKPDVVVLDGEMGWRPVLDVIEAASRLAAAPVFAVLKDDKIEVAVIARLIELQVRVMVNKPVKDDALLQTRLAYLLALRSAIRRAETSPHASP